MTKNTIKAMMAKKAYFRIIMSLLVFSAFFLSLTDMFKTSEADSCISAIPAPRSQSFFMFWSMTPLISRRSELIFSSVDSPSLDENSFANLAILRSNLMNEQCSVTVSRQEQRSTPEPACRRTVWLLILIFFEDQEPKEIKNFFWLMRLFNF